MPISTSPKQRMLNAYRGVWSECRPVSPEFWYYYPAKVLGVDMITFQREIPHWKAMLETFAKYGADGWCVAGAAELNPHVTHTSDFKKIPGGGGQYRESTKINYGGVRVERSSIFHPEEPSWAEAYPVKTAAEADAYARASLAQDVGFDFTEANRAHKEAGEGILVEFNLGVSFFDFFCGAMGFENAIMYFIDEGGDGPTEGDGPSGGKLESYFRMYTEHKLRLLREVAAKTDFESVFIGCDSSCNSLLGPKLWRRWDKPYESEITAEAHRLGLLVHLHNHGKIMDTVPDLAEIGFDCVCPFEREPGDVIGLEGLKKARRLLGDKVTFNGNVSTVATLIFGGPGDVRREVREIKEAFEGTPRLIIGTGDQVGGETSEENIFAMLEEGRRL